MTNFDAVKALCTKICTGFYPDQNVVEFSLIDKEISPEGAYRPKDKSIVRIAIGIVKGMTESSHSEAGISESWNREAIKENIIAVCKECGLDADEFVNVPVVEDGSNLW